MIGSLIAMAVCILLSAYFSATETAFSSVNKTRLRSMADKGYRRAALALEVAGEYDRLLSTILIGNNLVNIAVAAIGTVLLVDLLGDMGATVSTISVTIVVLIFGEVTPKSIAKDHSEAFSVFSAPIIRWLIRPLTPVNFLFAQWKRLVSRIFRSRDDGHMTQDELLLLLDEVQQDGAIDQSERELLEKAVTLGDVEAQDILTHRLDLAGVDISASREEIARRFTESRFSRLLVYRGSMDHIVGILCQKDFYTGTGVSDAPLEELMTQPVFVPPTEEADALLQLLRSRKCHVAVVVDEYGGTLGIVTMEDILEELVGEIWDEHDEVEEPFRQTDARTWLVDGGAELDDFARRFGLQVDSDSISLGGWIMEQMKRVPMPGDGFTFQDLTITVTAVADQRIGQVQVRLPETEPASV